MEQTKDKRKLLNLYIETFQDAKKDDDILKTIKGRLSKPKEIQAMQLARRDAFERNVYDVKDADLEGLEIDEAIEVLKKKRDKLRDGI